MVTSRRYAGPADLRAMQDLTGRLWSPSARLHVGDLAWGRFQHTGREPEWPTALWEAAGRTVAWGWVQPPGHLDLAVDPAHAELAGEVLGWFRQTVPGPGRTVAVSSAETHLVAALREHGFAPAGGGPFFLHLARDLGGLPEPAPPPGYLLRPAGDDVRRRVEAHGAAFHPSGVTEESYRAVRAAWPYRADLDWVAEAPDGSFAAYCLVWLDEERGAALLEPVGTTPGHRRLGLARAVSLAALRAATRAGASLAVVSPRGDDAYPVPQRLYRSIGFGERARTLFFHDQDEDGRPALG